MFTIVILKEILCVKIFGKYQTLNEIGKQLGIKVVFEEADYPGKNMCADLTALEKKNQINLRNFSQGLSSLLTQEKLSS